MLVLRLLVLVMSLQRWGAVDAERLAHIFQLFADADRTQETEQRCEALIGAKNAQFFEQHVYLPEPLSTQDDDPATDNEQTTDNADDRLFSKGGSRRFNYDIADHRSRLERISRTLRSSIYAPKMCNPETFYPTVFDGSESPMSCLQICKTCVPGSAAVCHQRNHRFPGIGQTCFCTYDYNSPLHNAVLVLKNARTAARRQY